MAGSLTVKMDSPEVQQEFKSSLGPAMAALELKQRAFVFAFLDSGSINATAAVLEAGYQCKDNKVAGVLGSRLLKNPKIQAALHEESVQGIHGLKPLAVAKLEEVLRAKGIATRDILRAIEMVMDRSGMPKVTEIKATTEHTLTDPQGLVDRIVKAARVLGLEPRALIGKTGVVIDAEFKVVGDTTGLEDVL